MKTRNLILCITFISTCLLAIATQAQSFFDYPRTANFVVIEYSQIITMIEDPDPTPLLRIYGDGRVLVHYPVYMKRAGDYEMRLEDTELQQLIASLELKGLFNYNKKNVEQLKQQSRARQLTTTPKATMRSEDTYSVIKINLGSYMPATSRLATPNFKNELLLKNLKWEAKDYPDVVDLKNAASAEEQLKMFTNHPKLIKIKQ